MPKKLLLLVLLPIALLAHENDEFKEGKKIFDRVCAACHAELLDKETALKTFKTPKAPPMNEVAMQLKTNIMIKDEDADVYRAVVIAFVKDYRAPLKSIAFECLILLSLQTIIEINI
ncbi:MAG: hypothetical protein IBX43_08010 [Campylobacterales bacterium]|nr:hypothetical protein [Campylobacterales bacterium]